MKLPVLVQHYYEHQHKEQSISFFSYLKLHYDNPAKDADHQRDMQLPFKSHESHANLSVFIPLIQGFEPDKASYVLTQSFIPLKNDYYSSSYLDNIWQPPRRA